MTAPRLPLAQALCDAANGPDAWVVIPEAGREMWLERADAVIWQLAQLEWVVVSMDDVG